MSYLISNFVFTLTATFLLGLLAGWIVWGRLKNKVVAIETNWRQRYTGLDSEYKLVTEELARLKNDIATKVSSISTLNGEKQELSKQLNSSSKRLKSTDSEFEHLKNQLGQTTARLHITSKELDKNKQELSALRKSSSDDKHLKTLLGEATKRYNKNGLALKQKQDQIVEIENNLDESKKYAKSLNKELEFLRTKLLKRDKEFENQIVAFSNLKNEIIEKDETIKAIQSDLETQKRNEITINEIHQRDEIIAALQQDISKRDNLLNDLESRENEISQLHQERIPTLENSIKQRDASISALETEITKLSKQIPPLHDNIEKRDYQITQLKQEVNTLQQKIPAFRSTISARDAHIRELEVFIKDAQKAILKPANGASALNGNGNGHEKSNGNGHTNGTNNNVVHINGNGNGSLKSNGKGVAKSNAATKPTLLVNTTSTNNETQQTSKRKLKSYGLKKPFRKPDDLKLISGIGPALEKTLHKCGIFYFEQISGFSRKDVNTVDSMLKFKGRIDRDEWIKQAKILMRGGTYTRKKPIHKKTPRNRRIKPLGMKRPSGELDDLQLINGVGPKLERKLHRLGIYHFEQIAGFTAEDIELVDSKLKTYKGRVKRDKWPMQARKLHKEFHLSQ